MYQPSLLAISLSAFVAVFILLGVLAAVMKITEAIFPAPPEPEVSTEESDPAPIAAIASAMQAIYPGTKITKIEEIK